MNARELAADTRDPVGALIFMALGLLSSLDLLPAGMTAQDLGEVVGWTMGLVAAVYAYWHHKDLKIAIRAGREKQAELAEVAGVEPEAPILDVEAPHPSAASDDRRR